MKYIELADKLINPVFSLQDLKVMGLKVYPYQLSAWVKRGYIIKLKNGLYLLSGKKERTKNEYIAFNLYQPSYVSLESALFRYGLIPEMVYNTTSVTTKTTRTFANELGSFIFRHIKKELFFGYRKIDDSGQVYLLAEPEKALIDYLYLNLTKINDKTDLDELRFNEQGIKKLRKNKITEYRKAAGNRKLNNLLSLLLNTC